MDRIQFKEGLQKLIKKHGLSYKDLALCWKLSESSVKRIMSSGDFSLDRLLQLADLIGIQMSELMQTIEGPPTYLVMNTVQDELLSNQPDLLYLYIRFTAGDDILNFSETTKIPLQTCWQMAYSLDKVGLIEIHKDNRIKISHKGPYYFKPDGNILKKLTPHYFKTHVFHIMNENRMRSPLDKPSPYYSRPFELYMTAESYKRFQDDTHRLFMKYRDTAKYDCNSEKFNTLKCISGLFHLDQFDAWKAAAASIPKSKLKM